MPELYNFNIGTKEKHKIIIYKNWWLGSIQMIVDGNKIKSKITWVGGKKEYIFEIGGTEKHYIKVNIEIPILFPYMRQWSYTISADGKKLTSFSR
ncbi:MAG: hypothetical protein AABX32_02110 [Nanoarchaeota archaeon]